jgi:hypothetical protein
VEATHPIVLDVAVNRHRASRCDWRHVAETMSDLRQFTVFAIVASMIGVGVLDIAFNHIGGNKSTISRVLLAGQDQNPAMAFLWCYGFAGLMAHLFWPTVAPFPDVFTTLWKSLLFMLPIFYLLYCVATIKIEVLTTTEGFFVWPKTLRLPFAEGQTVVIEMAVGAVMGFFLAKWLVPQHIAMLTA